MGLKLATFIYERPMIKMKEGSPEEKPLQWKTANLQDMEPTGTVINISSVRSSKHYLSFSEFSDKNIWH